MTTDAIEALIEGLIDMIKEGRITEADIPDDFEWLKTTVEAAEKELEQFPEDNESEDDEEGEEGEEEEIEENEGEEVSNE